MYKKVIKQVSFATKDYITQFGVREIEVLITLIFGIAQLYLCIYGIKSAGRFKTANISYMRAKASFCPKINSKLVYIYGIKSTGSSKIVIFGS